MSTSILFKLGDEPSQRLLEIDATPRISHTFSAEVTEHPVEEGGNITDHVRQRNFVLSLDGVIVDYPLNNGREKSTGATVKTYSAVGKAGEKTRSVEASNLFQRLQKEGVLCKVTTSLKIYENMVLKEYTTNKTPDTKGAIRFTLTFQEIKLVQSKDIKIARVSTRKAQPKRDVGNQTGKTNPPEEIEKLDVKKASSSLLDDLTGALKDGWKKYTGK